MSDRNYYQEARQIVGGHTMMLPERAHLCALVEEINAMAQAMADLHGRALRAEAACDVYADVLTQLRTATIEQTTPGKIDLDARGEP